MVGGCFLGETSNGRFSWQLEYVCGPLMSLWKLAFHLPFCCTLLMCIIFFIIVIIIIHFLTLISLLYIAQSRWECMSLKHIWLSAKVYGFFMLLLFMWWKYIKKYHQRLSNILKLPKKIIFGPFFTTSFVHKELRKLFRELFYLFFLYYEKGKIPTLISWLEFAYIRKD